MDRNRREVDRYLSERNVSLLRRVAFVIELLVGLRKQDFQAAGHFVAVKWGDAPWHCFEGKKPLDSAVRKEPEDVPRTQLRPPLTQSMRQMTAAARPVSIVRMLEVRAAPLSPFPSPLSLSALAAQANDAAAGPGHSTSRRQMPKVAAGGGAGRRLPRERLLLRAAALRGR